MISAGSASLKKDEDVSSPAQSAKLKIIYGLQVSKPANFGHLMVTLRGQPAFRGGGWEYPNETPYDPYHIGENYSMKSFCDMQVSGLGELFVQQK